MVGMLTMTRVDLLMRNKKFLESILAPDQVLILDNGDQEIDIDVPIERPKKNIGVSGAWNVFMREAFIKNNCDALVILQDDIIWDREKLAHAKWLLLANPDVDLFLSHLQWSVQIHRPTTMFSVGYFDERFWPCYCEDDDYTIRMIRSHRIYERFHELDPLPGSISDGTKKPVSWSTQKSKLVVKWGAHAIEANVPHAPWYETNRGYKLP
jgi:hypothetical protein